MEAVAARASPRHANKDNNSSPPGTFHLESSKPFTTIQLIFSAFTIPPAPKEGVIITLLQARQLTGLLAGLKPQNSCKAEAKFKIIAF